MEHAVGLCRVSTTGQADDGCSLILQKEKIQAYAGLNDLAIVEIVEEAGVSGRKMNRDGLEQVKEMVAQGKTQHVIIYKLDRMARNLRGAIEFSEFLQKHGAQLHSICEKIDTSTATGRFFFHIISAMASWEAETIAERTSQALQGKIQRGERTGSIPFGWDVGPDGVHLVENDQEQEIIRKMLWYKARKYSAARIAKVLNTAEVPTKHNGTWQSKQVLGVLRRLESIT